MKKFSFLILISTMVAMMVACLEQKDLVPPSITVDCPENETRYFSTSQCATFNVHIQSGEELRTLNVKTTPTASWNSDSTINFDSYVHSADYTFSFMMSKAWKVAKDSAYTVKFTAYTDDTSCYAVRKLRFKYVYPEIDSFDIRLGSAAGDSCLLDIEGKKAYPYTQYLNISYDLVYINELRPTYFSYGTCLASPNAPVLKKYFEYKTPSYPYLDTLGHVHKETICGMLPVDEGYSWDKINSKMIGDQDGWQYPLYINDAEGYGYGYGVSNLQKSNLYKFRLQNGRMVMIRLLDALNRNFPDSEVKLRVYYQK